MKRDTDRQSARAACRWVMAAAWVMAGVFIARTVQAQVEVNIGVDPAIAAAPAAFTVTASTSPADPVVDVRWLGLPSAPACSAISCPLQLNLAHCQRVFVEVTTLSGETGSAERTVCASDEGTRPPEVFFESDSMLTSSGEIAWRRVWLDGEEVDAFDPAQWVPDADGGCHVLDAWVADSAGRSASDSRMICMSADAPQPSLLVSPAPQTTADEIQFCGKVQHPLGRTVETIEGPEVNGRCAPPVTLVTLLTPVRWVVEDTAGLRSQTTSVLARSPVDAPYTLLFLVAPAQLGLPLDDVSILDLQALGGEGPFDVELTLDDESEVWLKKTSTSSSIEMLVDFAGIAAGEHTLSWHVSDERGLEAAATTRVSLGASSPDGGVPDGSMVGDAGELGDGGMRIDGGPAPAAQGLGAGCANRTVNLKNPLAGIPWLALLLLIGLRRRRS